MTVLSRGARVRRGGRRPGWVLLTTLLLLAIGASSALIFTDRAELLRLAVILALWAAIAGAFVSVLYRRQSEVDQARARDMKLVYDLQLDREISARREYELTVESQLRRELASELRAQAADEVAALRAELSALRASLEILFDTDLEHRPALGTPERQAGAARALSERAQYGAQDGAGSPRDWVSSDWVTPVRHGDVASRTDEHSIIDVPEEPLVPPRQPMTPREPIHQQPDPLFGPRHAPPPPPPGPSQAESLEWRPVPADGRWLPPGAPGSHWASDEVEPEAAPSGRRRRGRHAGPGDQVDIPFGEVPTGRHYGGESGRRSGSRHSAEHRGEPGLGEPPAPSPQPDAPSPPRLAPPPPPEPAPRHRGAEVPAEGRRSLDAARRSGGQSVADLLARLQTEPTGGGRRRRRDG
ncbi:DUF6779 domain-containing protein [Mycobacterium lacus]|uniref:Membrane protein n=1 Tax=Mycobacterium lacus TaxID=169765 RepID=A0A1X1YT02_9MYCO|nr:DUF6779 domain-containing protein [Mycobacterium lacus]MCV7124889.1 hypothetical protein [Mycobacterium lacus]ORW14216.1 hypothetical protein AWC15_13660 [Mycobacterium lacus]BBX99392.1 membrane protein [Mycobacterium lacus]